MARNGVLQLAKIRALTLATGNQQDIAVAAEATEGRFSRTDIRTLGIVDIAHAVDVSNPFTAVRQTPEGAQRRQHAVHWQPGAVA